ncbi:hypothetical protein Pst134EA_031808 [Puccinia striiformis f. sp. tritici]|uniref:uncharacterized protein n=1 Tax=Puccinia striiformis f. sp. tritici TaxID=168172 RepID=UPI0020077C47|nr:uncharacterized protein Pst134EA_031808 [Puccinia striiformis f. sp. tritici]KAH9442586.1 hypothetical protein Pst134EA_031808 [Puccinia striiformis f. sp. tritici]
MPILTACFPLLGRLRPKPTDRQPSADESLAYLADDCSGFLSDYVFDNSLTAAPGLAFDSTLRPDPISSHPSHLTPSPQPLSAPSTAAGRRATVASVPSRLPFCASGLIPSSRAARHPRRSMLPIISLPAGATPTVHSSS